MYSTKHAQKLFDLRSDQTIRNWIREFEEFFSFNATPGKGIDLQLSVEDMQVLDMVASMRAERRPAEEIYATLKSGQRGNAPEYTPEELDVLTRGDYDKYLSTQINELALKVELLTKENTELHAALQPVRDKNIQLDAERLILEKQVNELRSQLEEDRRRADRMLEQVLERERSRAQEQLERLLREIAELRYKMGQLEKDDK